MMSVKEVVIERAGKAKKVMGLKNNMKQKRLEKGEWYKIAVLGSLLTLCLLATYYFHFITKVEGVFTHFFYVPIILAGLWWSRKGILVAVFLALMLLLISHTLSPLETPFMADMARASMFVVVGTVVGFLNEYRLMLEVERQAYSKNLEQRVEERTKELETSEEKYRSLVESTEDSIYLVDGGCRYLFINDNHLSRIGLPVENVIGRTYGELHSIEDEKEFAEKVEEVFETGKSVQHEHRSRRDNRYFLRTLSSVKDSEGRTTAVTVISKDITEHKRAEEERERLLKELEAKNIELEKAMEHMADLEEVTRMKTEFLSITSHELKTPLTPLKAQLQMLQEGYLGQLNEKEEKSIDVCLRNLTRLDNLVADIMDISRIEAGRIKMIFKSMSINDVVKEAIKMQEPFAKDKNIKISAKLADLPTIIGDAERLRQAIGNLINNAIKFSKKSGKVTIETKRSDSNENIQFGITDYGVGISKEDQKKLFKPFSQIDTSIGREHAGTGLGLAITKGIIHAHNGRVWLESEFGKGTTIHFVIPIKQKITEKEASYVG